MLRLPELCFSPCNHKRYSLLPKRRLEITFGLTKDKERNTKSPLAICYKTIRRSAPDCDHQQGVYAVHRKKIGSLKPGKFVDLIILSDNLETEAIEDATGVLRIVVIGADDGAPKLVMRVFDIKPGSSTPFHFHSWEHEVFILSGKRIVKGKA